MRAPRPGTGNQDEAVEFFRADERERRPVSARNGAVCGSVKGYLDTALTSSEHPTWARHVPGSGLRTSARGHGSGGAPQTHELDHESPPGPRRPTESSPSSPGRSSSASDHRASRLSAGTSRSRAAVRRLAAGLLLLVAGLAAGPAAAQTSITQTGGGATWTLTGHTSVAAGGKYTFTITLESGTKPFGEYAGFYLPDTADNQDKLGTAPNNCTSPKQFCISFSGGSSDGIFNGLGGHDSRYGLLHSTSPHTLTARFAVAADVPDGSTIEFGAMDVNGVPRGDGLTITTTTLVSNTGQDNSGAVSIGVSDHAQAFGTGSNTAGYDLASIVLSLGNAPTGTGTLTVTVREDASGDPSGTALYTLTTPDPIVGNDLNTFPAPAGATLDANTTYWVVASYSAGTGTPNWWRVNLSDGIDSGGAAGWTIDSPYKQDSRTAPDGWTVGSSSRGMKLQVKGTAKGGTILSSDATLTDLALSGVTLDPTFVSTTETYTATVGNSVTETTVTATRTHSGATVAFKDGDDNALTNPVTLDVGDNVIKAVVTAEDLTAMKTYMVTVTREAATTTVPGAPTGLTATASGTTTIDLTWDAPSSDGGSAITGYRIEVSSDGGSSWTDREADTGTTNTTYAHTGLSAGTTRHYRVSAINSVGTGAASGTANATTETAVVTPTETEVAADWDLKPSGLSGGDKFRLLFITSTSRNAVPTAIADYNTFVQNRAAAGHTEIQTHSSGFRAVGSTEDVDARDNTSTTYTSSDKGVPIYWLDGNKVVDDYEDFYDGDWDEETTLKNESGTTFTATSSTRVWTGSDHDGTEYFSVHGFSSPLGNNPARVGAPNSSLTAAGPLTATGTNVANLANTETRRMYGLSSVFVVEDGPTLSTDATLSALTVNDGTTDHTIDLATTPYTLNVANAVTTVTLTATPTHTGASVSAVTLGGTAIADTDFTDGITVPSLIEGDNVIDVTVMAEDGSTESYMVTVTRAATTDTPVTIEAEYESIGAGLEDLLFTLTREGETTEALDVKVTIDQAQSWLSNIEYTVTFSANSATAELTITKSNFSFTPSTAGNLTATVSGDDIDGGSDTVQIISTSEPPFTASYDMPAYTFAEDATDKAIYLVVTLDAAYPRAVAIDAGSFSSRSGTATSPEDFATYSNQHVVSPGEFTRDVDTDPLVARSLIPDFILPDDIYEGSESFGMKIEAGPGLSADLLQFAYPDGTTCAPYSCSPGVEYPVTITDEGDLPDLSLSVDPLSIDEEDDGGTTGTAENVSTVTVEITNAKTFAVDQTITLTFTGTATRGTHYSVSPGDADTNEAGHQVVLVKETASVELTVTATGNDTADGHRTVTVAADLDGTAIGSSTITILDDETTTTTTPQIVTDGVEVTSTPATGDTYRLGETIEITVTFDNAVTVNTSSGTPRIELLLGSGNKWAEYSSGSGGTALEFTYDVQSGDMDADGISIEADRLQLRGGTITAAADNTVNAFVYYDALGTQTEHKVNGSTVPGAPTSLTATASGTSTIDLSWTAPSSDGGSAITGYRIEVSSNGGTSWTNRAANTGNTTTTYSHIGLSAGTTRHYRVSAINANGTGTASNVDNATTTTTVPGAPTSLTATANGSTQIDLSWTAPADDGGASISGYGIEVSSNGGTSWTTLVGNVGSTTYSHTGLSAGTTRHYRVSAINANGTGAASNVDNATTDDAAATVPGAPTGLTATASGSTRIDLSWTAPSSDGGSPITGYRITVSPNGTSGWSDLVATTNSTTTTYSHTGLAPGTTRHYRVLAINAIGQSFTSNVDDATTPTVPGAPTSLTATASGSTTIDLSWTAPSSDGGSPITGYRITVSPNGTSGWSDLVATTNSTTTTYSHTGLAPGTTRHYRVLAINAIGQSFTSNVDDATTPTVPGAPTSLTATASGSTTIDLSWTAPSSDGGSPITGYRITVSPNGTSGWSDLVATTNSTTTTYSHTGLAPGTTRHYRVLAINAIGQSFTSNVDDATTATANTVPGAPTGLTATADGTTAIDLSWTEPADNGGASISGYKIEDSPNGSSGWTELVANHTSTSYSHTGLSPGTTRHYRVSAINSVGTGSASNVANATTGTANTVPGAPTGLTATADGTTAIDLSWTEPADNGGSAITGYRIEVSPNGTSSWTNRVANTGSTTTSYSHTGLSAGSTRHYRVSAINSAGTGAASNVDDATTDDDDQPGLAVVTVHALATSVSGGGLARFELRRSGGDMGWLKVSYRHDESDGNYVKSWGYFKPGDTEKKADYYTVGSSGRVTARVTGPSDRLCTGDPVNDPSDCTDDYVVGNPASASMQVTASASSSDDALEDALTLVDDLTPDVAAAVLLGERTLGEAELAALDRLGNGNGRYDLGDLLSWIERCRRGEAHCGRTSTDSGPAAAALLGGAAAGGRSTPRRPGRRDSGRRGRASTGGIRRRARMAGQVLAVLLAATTVWSCTEGSVGPAAYVPDPGFLTVEWSGPATHRDVGVLLELEGPTIDAVRAPGFELYESRVSGRHQIVVAGSLRPGPFVQFRVPDRNRFALYRVRVLEVTGEGYGLRDPTEYRAVVIMN